MAGRKAAAKATETTAKKVEAIEPSAESIKTEEKVAESKAEEVKKESPKKAPAKTAAAKTTTTTTTKAAAGKKAEPECVMHVQFAGKSYAQADLMKIAKDVWKYDLKQKPGELNTVELYVKPEESMVYYVMNDKFTGSFLI